VDFQPVNGQSLDVRSPRSAFETFKALTIAALCSSRKSC